MIFVLEVHSAQTVHLSCAKTNTISKRTETCFHFTYITLEYHLGVPKAISLPEVHSAQTVHPSCIKTNTISKQTKTSFHLTYITLEYHSGVPKAISMPEVHSRKPGNYLSLRLILSQYELKQASTRHTLPRSTIRVCPKRFPCTWYIRCKQCTYLAMRLSPN